ncbi:MAG: hypothetical protein AMJ78_10440, partial [Omnitrophica WOR_2 bacterium SM23_29]
MGKIRVGVIGVGHLGSHHARLYSGMGDVELAGVCDINFGRVKRIARKYRTTAYCEYKDMFGKI